MIPLSYTPQMLQCKKKNIFKNKIILTDFCESHVEPAFFILVLYTPLSVFGQISFLLSVITQYITSLRLISGMWSNMAATDHDGVFFVIILALNG